MCLKVVTLSLILNYFFLISERAAVEAAYIDEIDELFKEAKVLENILIQKKEFLKQSLTAIANSLHGLHCT